MQTTIMSNSQDYKKSGTEQEKLISIRKKLHACPEYSHKEVKTAKILLKYLQDNSPDKIYQGLGGNGIIAEYSGKREGPSKMFRCEMDAIKTEDGFAHLCGHDGHMTILLGLAQRLSASRNFSGKIYLLFQPAEEVGEGAALMVKDIGKLGLKFDFAYALHNNPNYPLNNIIIHKGTYAAGSTGMELKFMGSPSHAAYPEQAISPTEAIIFTIQEIKNLNGDKGSFSDFILATIVNVDIGEVNYGVTPGEGSLRLTLRSFKDFDLDILCNKIEKFAKETAERQGLKLKVSYHDKFPATANSDRANNMVIEAARRAGLNIIYSKEPTRGSDDFSFFTLKSEGSFFDIGNGEGRADVHQPGYLFPDEILIPAINLFSEIIYRP
ncbi:MAG: amidohydrolase [Rikenellaceae bacterium]